MFDIIFITNSINPEHQIVRLKVDENRLGVIPPRSTASYYASHLSVDNYHYNNNNNNNNMLYLLYIQHIKY